MYAQENKSKENISRAVANNVGQKKSNVKQGFGFVDNRPSAKAQRIFQFQSFQRSSKIDNVRQLMSDKENETITNWIRMYAAIYLGDVKPDMITDAKPSKAVRLRWFNLKLGGENYSVGLNIHYMGGPIGGVWVKNKRTNETLEFHPHRDPNHGFGPSVMETLQYHIKAYDEALYVKTTKSISSSSEGNVYIGNEDL